MKLQRILIRTWLVEDERPHQRRESVVVSRPGGVWRTLADLQDWARREFADSCALLENGVRFSEPLGRRTRCLYEITVA